MAWYLAGDESLCRDAAGSIPASPFPELLFGIHFARDRPGFHDDSILAAFFRNC
jgi:hypothetical protein